MTHSQNLSQPATLLLKEFSNKNEKPNQRAPNPPKLAPPPFLHEKPRRATTNTQIRTPSPFPVSVKTQEEQTSYPHRREIPGDDLLAKGEGEVVQSRVHLFGQHLCRTNLPRKYFDSNSEILRRGYLHRIVRNCQFDFRNCDKFMTILRTLPMMYETIVHAAILRNFAAQFATNLCEIFERPLHRIFDIRKSATAQTQPHPQFSKKVLHLMPHQNGI